MDSPMHPWIHPCTHAELLLQHVSFWDADHDGVIWPGDTWRGFRRLGFNALISALAVPVIHGEPAVAFLVTSLSALF